LGSAPGGSAAENLPESYDSVTGEEESDDSIVFDGAAQVRRDRPAVRRLKQMLIASRY
jgi:hypothetical protein